MSCNMFSQLIISITFQYLRDITNYVKIKPTMIILY